MESRLDIQKVAEKWQKRWAESKLFEPDAAQKNKYFITVPYPYISGSLHIGHARVVTEADVFSRFQRMRGKNVLFPIAFHISGSPVLGICTAIKQGDKKKIELYKSYVRNYERDEKEINKIIKSFEEPQALVDFFIPKMKDEFSSLGLGVDWRRSFNSGDIIHQKLVEWQFKKYEEKEYLVQGKYPVLFSTLYDNAVGEDDIADGDGNPVDKQEFTLIKFKVDHAHAKHPRYILAATLRPETMYGQTNMWVHPDVTYQILEVTSSKHPAKKEEWIVSKECAEKLGYQDKTIKVLDTIEGKNLIGTNCHAPFVDRDIPLLPSIHCDPDVGTGLVTSVPSDAPFDYVALKELQDSKKLCSKYGLDHKKIKAIQLIPIITTKGYGEYPGKEEVEKRNITSLSQHAELEEATQAVYKAGFHSGIMKTTCGTYARMRVEQAKIAMKEALLSTGEADIFWETSRKAQDRSGGKIIVAILDKQWFLDFNAQGWKDKAQKALDALSIQPEKYRKQFQDVLEWLDKRPCARKRGLGTHLPQDPEWMIESLSDSTMYMALYTIQATIKEGNIPPEKLSPEVFDYIFLQKGDLHEVNIHSGIQKALLLELQHQFTYWYPNDLRHTFVNHLSNHLSFSLFAHAALFPQKYWPKKYSFHGLVVSEGQKMSKSKGNIVTLLEVKNKYGADPFRAFMCSSTSVESTFNWSDAELQKMTNHLINLYELLSQMNTMEAKPTSAAGKAFLSWFERNISVVTESLEKFDLRSYANFVLYELYNKYKKVRTLVDEKELHILHHHLMNKWIAMLSPLVPHIAEELWDSRHEGFVSVANWPESTARLINEKEEIAAELQEQLISDVRIVMQLVHVEKPKKIILISALDWKYDFFTEFKKQDARNTGEVMKHFMSVEKFKKYGQDITKLLPVLVKDPSKVPKILFSAQEEYEQLLAASGILSKTFACEVQVEKGSQSKEKKAHSALPGKPGVVLE